MFCLPPPAIWKSLFELLEEQRPFVYYCVSVLATWLRIRVHVCLLAWKSWNIILCVENEEQITAFQWRTRYRLWCTGGFGKCRINSEWRIDRQNVGKWEPEGNKCSACRWVTRNPRKRWHPRSAEREEKLNIVPHFIYRYKKKTQRLHCVQQSEAQGSHKETYFYRKTCTNQLVMCSGESFKRYHSLKNFKNFSVGPIVYRVFVDFVHRGVIVIRRKEYVYILY
jgi:hypothetical protein